MNEIRYLKESYQEQINNLSEQFLALPKTVPAIRLLPMSESDPEFEGQNIEKVQDWFRHTLPYINYNFKRGMETPAGSLVLFQFKGSIIALAILENKILHPLSAKLDYKGAYQFLSSSIAIFNPLTLKEMQSVWSGLKSLNQSSQKLDVQNYQALMALLSTRNFRFVESKSEEDFQRAVQKLKVPISKIEDKPKELAEARNRVLYRRSLARNLMTAKRAIAAAHSSCEMDETHKFFTSNATGENYVEAHHLIPIEFQREFDKSIDVEANIISLCAMCHKKIHHATMAEKLPMIEKLYELRKERMEKCALNITVEELAAFYN